MRRKDSEMFKRVYLGKLWILTIVFLLQMVMPSTSKAMDLSVCEFFGTVQTIDSVEDLEEYALCLEKVVSKIRENPGELCDGSSNSGNSHGHDPMKSPQSEGKVKHRGIMR